MNIQKEFMKLYEEQFLGNPFFGKKRQVMCGVLHHLEKYRWHNVDKNPKDLPKFGSIVLMYRISDGKFHVCDYNEKMDGNYWKYIEEFPEEDE